MKLSILTGTYNRANLLKRLYESIKNNKTSDLDLEWLIMDDGSTDNTREIVESFQQEKEIEIYYFHQENSGKMRAINELVPKVTGDFIVECDSDDYFRKGAFDLIKRNSNQYNENIYAIAYLKYDQNECNIGKLFSKEQTTMFDLYFKEGEDGEKALVFNASIRKQYQYELEHNEKFITEARMFHKMDQNYQIRCVNEAIMICEYQKEGYTKNILDVFEKNPFGYYEYFKEMLNADLSGVPLKKKMYIIKHYILFCYLTNQKKPLENVKSFWNKIMVLFLLYPGYLKTSIQFSRKKR